MDKQMIIGIMGPGAGATKADLETAFTLGQKLAQQSYMVLTGGRAAGVMEAAMKGAKSAGGTTIGILPSSDGSEQSKYVDIPIRTGMGNARNNINVLTSDVIVAIGVGAGTSSEIALAIKNNKPVILMNQTQSALEFYTSLQHSSLYLSKSGSRTLAIIQQLLTDL